MGMNSAVRYLQVGFFFWSTNGYMGIECDADDFPAVCSIIETK